MTMTTTLRTLSPQESGKLMRADLRRAFPGVKFSAAMSRGTSWGCFTVAWADGPSGDQVRAITDRYQRVGFDGLTDSTIHYRTEIELPSGEKVESGIRMISLHRNGFVS